MTSKRKTISWYNNTWLSLSAGPLSVAVAQGAAAELVWRVLEDDPEEEAAE